MRRFAVQFARYAVVGLAAAYAINLAFDGELPGLDDRTVDIPLELHQLLVSDFSRTWQRPPSNAELRQLITDYVREEIAWREGMRLRLGGDDAVLRHRFQNLLEAHAVAGIEPEAFTEAMLSDYLTENPEQFRHGADLTFRQLFFDTQDNVIGADAAARYLLAELRNRDMPDGIDQLGDPSPVPALFDKASRSDVQRVFGGNFAAELADLPAGTWSGPVSSRHGLHLVFIDERSGGTVPPLKDIEDAVRTALLQERQAQAIEALYQALEVQYDVTLRTDLPD